MNESPFRVWNALNRIANDAVLRLMARQVAAQAAEDPARRPVVFFNASTRLGGLSQNAAFSLLTAWALRLQGVPVVHFVCRRGMSRCVLGTHRDQVGRPPPCSKCLRQSAAEYDGAHVAAFDYEDSADLASAIEGLSLQQLARFTYQGLPLGSLALPSLRWVLRRHHLLEDAATLQLYREYIRSTWSVATAFTRLLDTVEPQAVVVFNGQFFPEAVACTLARQRGIRTVTHEVGLLPFTAFFTDGEATAYPIDIPATAVLSPAEEQRLDQYLEKRFQGNFTMAGIRFWQGMRPLDPELTGRMSGFRQTVPVFTNVIFDTSQPHSNVIFEDMFAWLDQVLALARRHPETLFVIRGHPDEMRPRSEKQSRETVRDWIRDQRALDLPNIAYIDGLEYLSSYELIRRSKFVMVYNSSIGLEASIMGVPVLSAGQSRYTRYPTVIFPRDIPSYLAQAEALLTAEAAAAPAEFVRQARRFLYYQLFKTALPFRDYVAEIPHQGLVRMRHFPLELLAPERSPAVRVIRDGLFDGQPFLLEESLRIDYEH